MAYVSPAPAWEDMNSKQKAAAEYAWSHGILDVFVMPHQRPLWSVICHHMGLPTDIPLPNDFKEILTRTNVKKPLVLEVSRRFGKTSLVFLAMLALCIRNKRHTYYFCAPSEGDAKDILDDVYTSLIATCPPKIRPQKKSMTFEFQNESRIKIGGTFNGAEGLRGRASNGSVIDEAGAIPPLRPDSCLTYVLSSILQPQLMTTKGWSVILTTPPGNQQHDYYKIAGEAERDGRFIRMDIYQNTGLTPEEIEEERLSSYSTDPSGGAWSREYLCKPKPDAKTLIIPEPTQELMKPNVIKYTRPDYFPYLHRYIAFDHGTVDLNAILFGYWDFPNAKLIVEKELAIPNAPTTKQISKQIANTRLALWNTLPVEKAICDSISQQIRIDLNAEFNDLYFMAPSKTILLADNGTREGMVNKLIGAISDGQIIVDPECKLLLETIRTATWKISATGKREFSRFNEIGHCDMLAALMYLWISIFRNINPMVGKAKPDVYTNFILKPEEQQGTAQTLARALNSKRRPSIFDLARNKR